jgi:3,4-dihydroxy-2-butanone 4-phosphate synthase
MSHIEKLTTALKAGKHVEIRPRVAQGSATFAVAAQQAARSAEADEYDALIRDTDGFVCTVTRREARELLEAGAVFIGHALRRP